MMTLAKLNADSETIFTAMMLKSSLYDYNDAYMLVKGLITVPNTASGVKQQLITVQKQYLESAPLTDCISTTNHTQIDNSKDVNIVKPKYNLTEYKHNYSKSFGSL